MDPEAEYAEYDVAEDGAGSFLVYRRGAWHPSNERGELLQSIPADDWEPGAVELPNGAIMGPRGSRGGKREKIGENERPDAYSALGEAPSVTAETRGRLAFGLPGAIAARRRMAEMESGGVNPLNRDWGASLIQMVPDFGAMDTAARIAGGQDFQNYDQAAASIEAAVLPIFSGLAVTESEARRFVRANVPRLGDTPETLVEKGRNIERVMNTGSWMMGQPIPFPEVPLFVPADEGFGGADAAAIGAGAVAAGGGAGRPGAGGNAASSLLGPTDPETGLPTYPTIQGGREIATPPTGPGASAEEPIDLTTASRDEVIAAIQRGGWFRQGPDGEPYELPASTPEFGAQPGDEMVAPGVGVRPRVSPEQAIDARREDEGLGRRADTFVRGVADAATFGLSDEITAGLNTVAPLDRGTRGGWDGDWGGAYRQNLDLMRGIDEADAEQMPLTRGAGQITGALAGGVGAARMAPQFMRQAPRVAGATRGADTLRRGANVARLAGGGAAGGGAYGLGASEGNLLERAPNALEGAAIGGVLGPVAGVVGDAVIEPAVGGAVRAFNRALRPNALVTQADEVAANMGNVLSDPRAQAVQTLTDNGVYLTSGQRAGGLAQTVENLAQRAPILGTAIRGARNRGQESLNRAVGNRALDPIGEGVPANIPAGGETVSYVSGRLGREFDRAAEMVPEISATPELREGVARIVAQASDLPEAGRQQLAGILESRLTRLDRPLTGTQYRDVEREIGTLAAQYGASPDPAQQQMGNILSGVGEELRTHLGRVNPEAGEILRNASEGWADFVRMRQASVASGGRPFSPGQLSTAVRTQDSSVAHGAVGRGEARMQDLSRAASTVMPDSYGNPGTADAAGWGGLGIGMLTAPVQTTGVAATLGAGALPYLAAGRNMVDRLPAAASRQGDNILRRFVARGFSEEEARGLTAAAVDPARAREVIDFLATRMNRQEARSMLRAIRFAASRGAGEYAGDEE